jgi:quercetin dioxygenase-like cupin family protein
MEKTKPIRRVVTGQDERGRSCVRWDGPAPNVHEASSGPGRSHTDLWAWDRVPAPLTDDRDDGAMEYDFPCPPEGGHLRVIQMRPKRDDYDAAADPEIEPAHDPVPRKAGRAWDRGGKNLYSSNMHLTQTVDYGIVLSGERELILDDAELLMRPGDVVVQIASWHQWSSPRIGCQMAFDMFAATLTPAQRAASLGSGLRSAAARRRSEYPGPGPRRIVTVDQEDGTSTLVSDGPAPHVTLDPARPGFASAYLWSTAGNPAPVVLDGGAATDAIEPPRGGTLCRVLTIPPDDGWRSSVGRREVAAWFAGTGSPGASAYDQAGPHPYLQRTAALEFGIVLAGTVTLVLDTAELDLAAGDVVVQRGSRHAWSNRGDAPAVVALTAHAGAYGAGAR